METLGQKMTRRMATTARIPIAPALLSEKVGFSLTTLLQKNVLRKKILRNLFLRIKVKFAKINSANSQVS